jgi:histone H3/H4
MFRMLPFERSVREIVKEMGAEMRFSEDALSLIQSATEDYLLGVYKASDLVAHHAGRTTVMMKDLSLVCKIRDGF